MKEKQYFIENKGISLPEQEEDWKRLVTSPEIQKAVAQTQERYLPWALFKNKSWVPKDKKAVWSLVKLQRQFNAEKTPILDKERRPFLFNPRSHVQFLHEVDLELGGNFMGIQDFSEGDKRKFIRRNLIEESIASSQLEGANSSRSAAKKMLSEGRLPKNKGEQMIVNNHRTMQWIEEEICHQELSLELLKELHKAITHNTIAEQHQGVLRETFDASGNPLVIKPWDDNIVTYITPPRDFVEEQLPRFIAFANDKDNDGFIHPVIKAIMLHFWLAVLHPFEDGNGRLARTIFYWYMLRKKYWAFSYISLSERILKSSKEYAEAFVYSEQDDNDLNYFIHYNIQKLKLAREQFQHYIGRKISENRQAADIIRKGYNFNQRQIQLLQHLAKDEQEFTSLSEYNNINDTIGNVTASTDLRKLVEGGFLKKIRNGRNIFYYPTPKIQELFRG